MSYDIERRIIFERTTPAPALPPDLAKDFPELGYDSYLAIHQDEIGAIQIFQRDGPETASIHLDAAALDAIVANHPRQPNSAPTFTPTPTERRLTICALAALLLYVTYPYILDDFHKATEIIRMIRTGESGIDLRRLDPLLLFRDRRSL